jgi:hypothetical protein
VLVFGKVMLIMMVVVVVMVVVMVVVVMVVCFARGYLDGFLPVFRKGWVTVQLAQTFPPLLTFGKGELLLSSWRWIRAHHVRTKPPAARQ